MSQAVEANTGPAARGTPDNSALLSGAVSRRGLLGTAALVAAAPGLALAVNPSGLAADAEFWAAHARWRMADDAWEASDAEDGPEWDALAEREVETFDTMMMIPVFTVGAVLAKYRASGEAGLDYELPAPAGTSTRMIEMDLERIAEREKLV